MVNILIYVDKALETKISGCVINDVTTINADNKDKHYENKSGQNYPCITWFRMSNVYDIKRYTNNKVNVNGKDANNLPIIRSYKSPDPFNIIYQIEIIAKERFDYDILEMFMNSKINPRGSSLSVNCFIEETNTEKIISFPMKIEEARELHDLQDRNNKYYRKVYTISVEMFLDLSICEDESYVISSIDLVDNKEVIE